MARRKAFSGRPGDEIKEPRPPEIKARKALKPLKGQQSLIFNIDMEGESHAKDAAGKKVSKRLREMRDL